MNCDPIFLHLPSFASPTGLKQLTITLRGCRVGGVDSRIIEGVLNVYLGAS